jgi:undecaprenyl-diphosphatase
MLSLLNAVIIGLFQGILEWIPVSSEGSLVIVIVGILGIEPFEALQYSIFLHLGTGIAALIYFKDDVVDILTARDEKNRKLRLDLLVISVLAVLISLPLYLFLEISTQFGEALIALTGIALIITGLIQKNTQKNGLREYDSLTSSESVLLGFIQGLSIIPGISRSGITTSALIFLRNNVESAFKMSFLMSIPVSFAAALGIFILEDPVFDQSIIYSLLVTIVVGYLTIDILLKLAKRMNFWKIVVGLGALALLAYLPNLF